MLGIQNMKISKALVTCENLGLCLTWWLITDFFKLELAFLNSIFSPLFVMISYWENEWRGMKWSKLLCWWGMIFTMSMAVENGVSLFAECLWFSCLSALFHLALMFRVHSSSPSTLILNFDLLMSVLQFTPFPLIFNPKWDRKCCQVVVSLWCSWLKGKTYLESEYTI